MSYDSEKEFIVTWYIENYSFCSHGNGDVIESPFFRTECLKGSKWKLCLVPREINDERETTQCFLKRYDQNGEISIDYKIEMIDSNGTILETAEGKNEKFISSGDSDCTLEIESSKLDMQHWNENKLTIRCHMRSIGPHPLPAIGCEVRTKIGIDSCSFIWEINLPLIDIFSKVFSILENTKLKTELSKSCMSCNDPVVIKISKIECDVPIQRLVSCKITLIDASGSAVKSGSGTKFFISDDHNEVWDFPFFLTSLDLQKHSFERKKATLQFEFSVTNGMQSETPLHFQYSGNVDGLLTLQNDMRGLFLSKKHTDVQLKLDETTTILAHKSVLIARSPFFSKMFEQDMVESQSGISEITEDETTMTAFLEYLYTGTIEKMNCDCAKNLLLAADKYQVPSLKDKCATYLMNALTIHNVCEILDFLYMIEHQQLKSAVLDYIAVHVKEVMNLSEWSTVKNKNGLAEEILSTMVQKFNMIPKTALDQ